MFSLIERKIRLLRVLAKPTITKVRHYADDFNIRLSVRSRTRTDSHAQGAPPAQVALHECFVHDGRAPARFAWCARITFIEVSSRNDSYTHGLEKSRRNRVQIDVAVSRDSFVCKNRHLVVPASAGQQWEPSYCRRLSDRRLTDCFIDAANQQVSFRCRVPASQRVDTERDQTRSYEARPLSHQCIQSSKEQSRTYDKRKGQGNLHGHNN